MSEDNSAAGQYRQYAGIKAGHPDVENKSKAGGPVDLDERARVDVEGNKVEVAEVPEPPKGKQRRVNTTKKAAAKKTAKKAPAKKAAAKKTTAKKTAKAKK